MPQFSIFNSQFSTPPAARRYHSALSLWLSVDPLSDKYPNLSPYVYCANNPVGLKDPDGREIEVVQNDNGTYTITGGVLNKNRNIYVVKDGKRTGVILGQTMTDYSFFNEEGSVVKGAVNNPSDNSGKEFIQKIVNDRPSLVNYIYNARNGRKFDFKSQNGTNNDKSNLRGMPLDGIEGILGSNIYGTARDVGNYAAGYVAAASGLDWDQARIGFDIYQSIQSKCITTEAQVSQSAQKIGYEAGKDARWIKRLYNKFIN